MKSHFKAAFIAWRFNLLIIFLILIILGLVTRLVFLAVFKKEFLQTQGDARSLRIITEPAYRGMITDREGFPLAITTSIFAIWMNPALFQANNEQIKALSQLLMLRPLSIKKLFARYKNTTREFIYLKRDVSPEVAKKIKALQIPGIYLQESVKRYYPEGEVTAHVIGFTNIDDQGQEGLELSFNDWLTGRPGKKLVIKDRLGRTITDVERIQEKKPGRHLALSINHHVQYVAYRELMTAIEKNQAESGSIIVLDVKTGEVLAMANLPSFNPNNRSTTDKSLFRNRAVTDVFEPGSTIKAFSIASALDSGQYKPNTVIDTYPGWMRVDGKLVHDEHNNGPLTLSEILQISSNVGVTKMILSLQPNQLWNLLRRVGFGEITGIGFPGERSGELLYRENWRPVTLATLAFGYGISVTTLQLAQAYSVIANKGIKIPLSLVRVDQKPQGKPVMSPEVAAEMLELLESVVTARGATGRQAQIPGYRVAGKTGTAWPIGKNGYEKHRYVASFVGIAPVSNPRFVVAVVIRDPKGKQYLGGPVSGPVFSKVMSSTLHLFNVLPDQQMIE